MLENKRGKNNNKINDSICPIISFFLECVRGRNSNIQNLIKTESTGA